MTVRNGGRRRRRAGAPDPLFALAIAATLFGAAVIVAAVHLIVRVSFGGGCGDDGSQYCGIAQGHVAFVPYNRRPLLPELLRVVGVTATHVQSAFLSANLASLVLLAATAGFLTFRLAKLRGAASRRAVASAVLAGVVPFLAPFGFRWVWFYPTLVDPFALALLAGWLVTATCSSRRVIWLSPVLATLAVCSRESAAVVLACGSASVLMCDRSPLRRGLTAVSALGIVSGLGYDLLQPGLPNPAQSDAGSLGYAIGRLGHDLSSIAAAKTLSWEVLFAVGFLPVLLPLALRRRTSWKDASTPRMTPLEAGCLGLCVGVVPTLFGGDDVSRFATVALPFTAVLALSTAAGDRRLDPWVGATIVLSFVVWRPFDALDGGRVRYLEVFSPQYLPGGGPLRFNADMHLLMWPAAACAALVIAATVADAIRTRSQETSQALLEGRPPDAGRSG